MHGSDPRRSRFKVTSQYAESSSTPATATGAFCRNECRATGKASSDAAALSNRDRHTSATGFTVGRIERFVPIAAERVDAGVVPDVRAWRP
jgi:hypothetical protein